MKRKMFNIICIASMLLTCSCGKDDALPGSSEIFTETGSESIISSEISSSTALSQSLVSFDDSGYIIWDEDGVHAELLQLIDESGEKSYVIKVVNSNDYDITLKTTNTIINGEVYASGAYINVDSNSTKTGEMRNIYVEDISSIDMTVTVTESANYESTERKVSFTAENTKGSALMYSALYGALAREQILIDSENVRATLLGAGSNQNYSYGTAGDFSGIIRFENKSDTELPLKIDSVCINGISFASIHSNGDVYLPPDTETLLKFEVSNSDMEEKKITSIWNVSLQILTSEDENSGYSITGLSGGSWYDVELAEKGEEIETNQGQLVYEDDFIAVYCTDEDFKEYSNSVRYTWPLRIKNKTDQDIALHTGVYTLNGGDVPNGSWDVFLYPANCIRANSYTYTNMQYSGEKIQLDEVTATFNISNLGGSKRLHESEKPIIINRAQLGFTKEVTEENEN